MVEASPVASRATSHLLQRLCTCAGGRVRRTCPEVIAAHSRTVELTAPAPAVIETILPVEEYIAPAPGVVAVPVTVTESIGTIPRWSQHHSFRKCPSFHFCWSKEEIKKQPQQQGKSYEKKFKSKPNRRVIDEKSLKKHTQQQGNLRRKTKEYSQQQIKSRLYVPWSTKRDATCTSRQHRADVFVFEWCSPDRASSDVRGALCRLACWDSGRLAYCDSGSLCFQLVLFVGVSVGVAMPAALLAATVVVSWMFSLSCGQVQKTRTASRTRQARACGFMRNPNSMCVRPRERLWRGDGVFTSELLDPSHKFQGCPLCQCMPLCLLVLGIRVKVHNSPHHLHLRATIALAPRRAKCRTPIASSTCRRDWRRLVRSGSANDGEPRTPSGVPVAAAPAM